MLRVQVCVINCSSLAVKLCPYTIGSGVAVSYDRMMQYISVGWEATIADFVRGMSNGTHVINLAVF